MILVSGATGRVGMQVVRTLRRLNLDTRALVRKGSEYFWLNDTGTQYFFGDLRDPASLRRACRGMRYLILCHNVAVESVDNNHDHVTVRGTEALLGAAVAAGVGRVVLVSCRGVDRHPDVVAFAARKRAEEHVMASGLDFTILRVGPHEGVFLDLAERSRRSGRLLMPGPGDNLLSPLATVDIARMAAASLDLADARGQILELGGPPRTARELTELAAAAVGAELSPRALPGAVVSVGARLGRPVRRYANRLAELGVWFSEELVADPEASAKRFNIKLTDIGQAMAESGRWLVARADPEEREKLIVHRQFYATIYEPGTAPLAEMPLGPPPRQDG